MVKLGPTKWWNPGLHGFIVIKDMKKNAMTIHAILVKKYWTAEHSVGRIGYDLLLWLYAEISTEVDVMS